MRVVTVGSLPPEWGGPVRGGVATFHATLLAGFLERRDELQVVGVLPPTPLDRDVPVPVFTRSEDTPRASFYEDLLGRLQPDVVLMNHVAHTLGVTHSRLESPVPAVGVVHSWHNVTFAPVEDRKRAIALTQEALGGLSAMVAPSRHSLAEGRELGFSYPPVAEVIHNPLQPLYVDDHIDVSARERCGVLYLGSLIPRKNPIALVEAAASLPGLRVLLVGKGELEEPLELLIRSLGLGGRVNLGGSLPDADHLLHVRDLLLRSQMVCVPSASESFGLVFIEALACGTPIVGFGPVVREIRDEIGIDIGEPLDTGSPEEIAAAVERVGAVTWDRERLRRATLDTFALRRVVPRYVELLSSAAGRQAVGDVAPE
jgi:glycosyltransferase involved in cell wall biosynthesis